MSGSPDVRIGQIWQDLDPRCYGRRLKVQTIEDGYAICENPDHPGRVSRIRLTRFRKTNNGYELVEDAPVAQGTERTAPDRQAAGSSPAGSTMTNDKILQALNDMRTAIRERAGWDAMQPRRTEHPEEVIPADRVALEHVLWMCDETEKFVAEGRQDKAFRWLGFIQGVLWSHGVCSIEEMKKMNAPEVAQEATPIS